MWCFDTAVWIPWECSYSDQFDHFLKTEYICWYTLKRIEISSVNLRNERVRRGGGSLHVYSFTFGALFLPSLLRAGVKLLHLEHVESAIDTLKIWSEGLRAGTPWGTWERCHSWRGHSSPFHTEFSSCFWEAFACLCKKLIYKRTFRILNKSDYTTISIRNYRISPQTCVSNGF